MQKKWPKRLSVFGQAIWVALCQSMGRLTLWLACHGVLLPWRSWAEDKVSAPTLERYRRRALVSKLKAQRYRISRGPYFLRSFLDNFFALLRFLQFPALLVIKVILAILICSLPFAIFFAIRVYLPVPDRIARLEPHINSQLLNSSQALVPEVIRIDKGSLFETKKLPSEESLLDSYFSFRVLDDKSSEGLLIQGDGTAHKEIRRGWLIKPSVDLLFKFVPQRMNKLVKFRFRSIPINGPSAQCKFQVMNDLGKVLFASTFDTFSASRNLLLKSPLTRTLQEKLMPDFATSRSNLTSQVATLSLPAGETHLRFRIESLEQEQAEGVCSALLHGVEWSNELVSRGDMNNKRSMLFLLFDSMNADVASDGKLMPWLSGFLRLPHTMHFSQHHAVDVRASETFRTIMGIDGREDILSGKESSNLIEKLRSLGYRVINVGSFDDLNKEFTQFVPDLTVKIENETYEPRLVLSQLFNVISEEGHSPVFIILRMKGLSAPLRPAFSDIKFRDLFWGGGARGVMDVLTFSHLKTLDRELDYHFGALDRSGVLSQMDVLVSAERGFDLGLNLTQKGSMKPTFTQDLLVSEDTLRVPLGIAFAENFKDGLPSYLKNRNILTSHPDLMRTLWEGFGVRNLTFPADSRRLWNRNQFTLENRTGFGPGHQETDFMMRMIPLRSKLQQGLLFVDPDSTGGVIKYVSQSLPSRINVPDAYGWGEQILNLPAGEQFRQVSKRGQKEEIIARVNNRYVREARRVMRQERRFPLRLRITAHSRQILDLIFEEKSAGSSSLLPKFGSAIKVQSTKSDAQTYVHHVMGMLEADESFDLRGSANSFRILENRGEGFFVACPESFVFSAAALTSALNQKTVCILEKPSSERLAQFQGLGKKALSFWLVEDENQICRLQEDNKTGIEDYSECLEATPHDESRG